LCSKNVLFFAISDCNHDYCKSYTRHDFHTCGPSPNYISQCLRVRLTCVQAHTQHLILPNLQQSLCDHAPVNNAPTLLQSSRMTRAWAGTPSLEGPRSLPDSGRASPCMRDGEFFLRLLQTEVERMEGWCQNMEREAEENELPEEILELIRNAVGSAQMLMSQKVQQFFRLCQQSVDPSAYPQPTSQDLAGFWDLLQLNIEDVRVKFQDLQRLKDSGWRLPPEKKEDKKLPPPLPKKPAGGVSGSLRKSLDLGDRQRTEARRRLLQTKRTASFRQNSATESADSIEIYIPEAQTRL
uniref:Discs, large (Drosophila) homolog-associated protein 3 n=1 Tax=Seriola dumerili TaxID=41447 RepID=A0A3B4TFA5_SERDU